MVHALRRKLASRIMVTLTALSAAIAVSALLAVLAFVAIRGAGALNVDLLTQLPTPVGVPGGGVANALVGSLIVIGVAALLAIPVGLGAGIYLSEFGGNRFDDLVRYPADVLSGVPSIVIGIFVYNLIVSRQGHFSSLSGGVALSIMMLPSIIRTTDEMLRMVPDTQREAALALGITRWRTIVSVVLPGARAGVTTGILLAVARVAGETAPLLFTAFGNPYWSARIDAPIATLPHTLFTYAISPYSDWQSKAWGTALILTAMMLITSILARRSRRFA